MPHPVEVYCPSCGWGGKASECQLRGLVRICPVPHCHGPVDEACKPPIVLNDDYDPNIITK